jgi:flagellar hook assembly protein FlgD
LTIEAYNEAGEKVRLITSTGASSDTLNVDTMANSKSGNVFVPLDPVTGKGGLVLRFTGMWTPGQTGGAYSDFAWDGYSDSGQALSQGIYYIKISVTDEFGHVNTEIKEVQLLRPEQYVRVNIYNSAGELVRRLEDPNVTGTSLNLNVEDPVYVGNGNLTSIKLGNGSTLSWDGKNSEGMTVSTGVYEIQVEVKTANGFTTVATKTVSVLNGQSGSILLDPANKKAFPKAYPNPDVAGGSPSDIMTFAWFASAPGAITVRIYNIAGEMVRQISGDLSLQTLTWDLRVVSGEYASTGLYVAVFDASARDGRREHAATKLSIIRNGSYY